MTNWKCKVCGYLGGTNYKSECRKCRSDAIASRNMVGRNFHCVLNNGVSMGVAKVLELVTEGPDKLYNGIALVHLKDREGPMQFDPTTKVPYDPAHAHIGVDTLKEQQGID